MNQTFLNIKSEFDFRTELLIIFLLMMYTYTFSDRIAIALGAPGFTDSFNDFDSIEIISILLFAPIVEEIICRGHLAKNENLYWLMLIPTLILGVIVGEIVVWLFCLFIVFAVTIYALDLLSRFRRFIFITLFISTAVIFSLLHIPLVDSGNTFNNYLVVLMAYLPGAAYLGYIRFKYGIVYSILLHSFLNFITLLLNGVIY